jgi:indolepyruvate ferredoxin oxidoreductase
VTHALINSEQSITSAFVRTFARQAETGDLETNPDPRFHSLGMAEQIIDSVGENRALFLDASKIATALMGDSIATNTFMLGHAYQMGWLPVGEAALMQAIELNGTAVEFNRMAFLWGRRAAVDLPRLLTRLESLKVKSPDRELSQALDERISRRMDVLRAYQDDAYAQRYLRKVEAIRLAEVQLLGEPGPLTEAVARYYFKVLAIKDEYEVARLFTDGEFLKKIEANFEGDFALHFHLAPPLLNKAGVEPKKSSFGPWMLKGFKVLARLKFLRNTWLDPFGRTHERQVERQWLEDYEVMLDLILKELSLDNHLLAISLAELPDAVRGYGAVKERYLLHAEAKRKALLKQWRGEALFVEVAPMVSKKIEVTQL